MCAVCFSVAQIGPAAAVVWRARYAAALRRRVIHEAEAIVAEAEGGEEHRTAAEREPADGYGPPGSTA
jgi:hypothetical protein